VQGPVDGKLPDQPVFELQPVIDALGQPLVVDDDQQIEIGSIALGRVRLIDPAAPGVAAIKDQLLDPALLLPLVRGQRQRILEFFEDDLLHALKLALLVGRKVIEIGTHGHPLV